MRPPSIDDFISRYLGSQYKNTDVLVLILDWTATNTNGKNRETPKKLAEVVSNKTVVFTGVTSVAD